jgi:hypothetical protein
MLLNIYLLALCTDHAENTDYIVNEECLRIHCIVMVVLLLHAFVSAGMCLPKRCLAMNIYTDFAFPGFQASCHSTVTGDRYLHVLQEGLLPFLQGVCVNF